MCAGARIKIDSEVICSKNLEEWQEFGIVKSDNNFLTIKEQYDCSPCEVVLCFYMVIDGVKIKSIDEYKSFNVSEVELDESECNHKWYTVYKGDYPDGRRCEFCGKQEWG